MLQKINANKSKKKKLKKNKVQPTNAKCPVSCDYHCVLQKEWRTSVNEMNR